MTTPVDTTAPTTGFAARLRASTATDHHDAEHSTYMDALMAGELDRGAYTLMVAQQWFVYSALEGAADSMRHDPVAGAFVFDELARLAALTADLEFLMGPDWQDHIAPSAATASYCGRLREVGSTWPGGFVAHHYTRYMGDLSGGPVIGRVVQRVYRFDDGRGVGFYRFDGIDDAKGFKQRYRDMLDQAPWDPAEQERIIDEVHEAYRHNTALLADLDRAITPP